MLCGRSGPPETARQAQLRRAPALMCQQCGEAWVVAAALSALKDMATNARAPKLPVESVTMAASV